VIIVRLKGGLGNQLFQYALGRRLAAAHRTNLKLDLEEYQNGAEKRPNGLASFTRKVMLEHFRVSCEPATGAEADRFRDPYRYSRADIIARGVRFVRKYQPGFRHPKSHVRERAYTFDPAVLKAPDNCYLEGFWQTEKYFADVEEIIREEFLVRDRALVEYAENYLRPMRSHSRPLVALHVRRGDLAHAQETLGKPELVHGKPIGLDYISAAMACFPKDAAFLVFSDSTKDLGWCRQNIRGQNLFFAEGHTDMQDFVLMSRCDHNIIANSTFSWWAAWLNESPGRRVIAPREWASPGGPIQMDTKDLLRSDWEIL
jgi:hypothetical protein